MKTRLVIPCSFFDAEYDSGFQISLSFHNFEKFSVEIVRSCQFNICCYITTVVYVWHVGKVIL